MGSDCIYRAAELAIMNRNFTDPREPYARLRRAFVYQEKPSHTPPHLARHQTRSPFEQPQLTGSSDRLTA